MYFNGEEITGKEEKTPVQKTTQIAVSQFTCEKKARLVDDILAGLADSGGDVLAVEFHRGLALPEVLDLAGRFAHVFDFELARANLPHTLLAG